MTDLTSRPYHPDPDQCCEACIFGSGVHAPFCAKASWVLREAARRGYVIGPDGAAMQSRVLYEPCD